MHRRSKIIVIAAVVLLAVGAVFFFRKPSAPPADAPSEDIAWQAPRETPTPTAQKPAPASHLTGQIEPPEGTGGGRGLPTIGTPGTTSDASVAAGGFSPFRPRAGDAFGDRSADVTQANSSVTPDSAAREQLIHRIADGETLTQLAERYLGNADRYKEIFELNRDRLTSSDLLPIGVELRIPASGTAVTAPTSPVPGPMVPIAPRSGASGSGGVGGGVGSRTYRVERGDTLSGIAKKIYGDARRYRELFEANRHQLTRPEDLREGAILIIP
ncbi:MAG: LysM peptidoglycan-binding domain-containing protein [Planctomycetia bacterium]|nr:LysM peptidoglycan-binding domain-containing protein [Planctomycetia bacterium]